MPDTSSNDVLSAFLADLRVKLKIDDNGNGTTKNTVSYLNTLNKKISFKDISYLNTTLANYIKQSNVAIMYGDGGGNAIGHAWVSDGYRKIRYGLEYQLYVLNPSSRDFDYIKWHTEYHPTGQDLYTFHMNWGYDGYYDGWVYDGNWVVNGSNYSYNKGMILNQ